MPGSLTVTPTIKREFLCVAQSSLRRRGPYDRRLWPSEFASGTKKTQARLLVSFKPSSYFVSAMQGSFNTLPRFLPSKNNCSCNLPPPFHSLTFFFIH